MLQADSEKLRQAWILAVQASIASAYREIPDNYYIEVRHLPMFSHDTKNMPFSFFAKLSFLQPFNKSVTSENIGKVIYFL